MIQKLIFNKETEKVYCVDTDGNQYAEFPICFNFWAPHTAIANGTYPITNEDNYALEYGHYVGDAYGNFWVALDRETGKGFHGYGAGRTLTSGTYGCIRGNNEAGEQICRAIDEAIASGIDVTAEVVGDVADAEFCVGDDGRQ